MTSRQRFVSWAAVSSLPQAKKISIEDQLANNRRHVERRGGELVAELVVPGESRSITLFEDAARKMPAYAELKRLIDNRAFDVLIYLDRSRLGRKASLSMTVVELCTDAGIAVYETENPPAEIRATASHDDMLIGAIKSVGAQREIQKIQERHRMGMIGRAQNGLPPNNLVYGYRWQYADDGSRRIVIDEAAADVVREIIALYLSGMTSPSIAQELNGRGIVSPTGRMWTGIKIYNIVKHGERYAGFVELNKVSGSRPYLKTAGAWPPIIDENTLAVILSEIQARARNHRISWPYVLTAACYCQVCGAPMRYNPMRGGQNAERQIRCMQHRPGVYVMEHYIFDALRSAMSMLRHADIDALVAEQENPLADIEAQMATHHANIKRLEAALKRADDAYVQFGALDAARYAEQVRSIQAQIAAERKQVELLANKAANVQQAGNRRERLESVIATGLSRLDSDDAQATNVWLRRTLRVWVGRERSISVEWL